jgi:UDP-N-acetylmuramoyl-L-alanyl-D-glutamate--2,6-diaminopimelate ligase
MTTGPEPPDPEHASPPLGDLIAAIGGAAAALDPRLAERHVRAIAHHSAAVEPGSIFVAIPGAAVDGHRFAADAVARGAVAIVAEKVLGGDISVPVIRVPDARRALAELAAAWYGEPAAALSLVGITGTVGKTSVLSMLEAIMTRADRPIGTIGSLGIGIGGAQVETGFTAPDAPTLHRALAHIHRAGLAIAAMEVTSHALMQRRVETLAFDLGVFMNLVPFEHVDYHRTFRGYVDAKTRFFEHLKPAAPLIYNVDDRAVRGVVRGRGFQGIPCGRARAACVRCESIEQSADRTTLALNVRRPLPRLAGGRVEPLRIPVELRLLGRTNQLNAALAATAALCMGAAPDAVVDALRVFPAPRRRMQLHRLGGALILDDTVGHPESLNAVFEVVPCLQPAALHVVFGIRGSRGRRINRRLGEALGIWAGQLAPASLVVTTCADVADERNRVRPAERAAFIDALRKGDTTFVEEAACRAAVERAAGEVRPGDLLLLLGAQGMDRAAEFARAVLAGGRAERAGEP